MAITYRRTTPTQEIILEFDDDWEHDPHFPDTTLRLKFVNLIFDELIKNFIKPKDVCRRFQLVHLKYENSICHLWWNDPKNPFGKLNVIHIPSLAPPIEYKAAASKTAFSEAEMKKFLPELGIEPEQYLAWKQLSDQMIQQYLHYEQRFADAIATTYESKLAAPVPKDKEQARMMTQLRSSAAKLKTHLFAAGEVKRIAEDFHGVLEQTHHECLLKLNKITQIKQGLMRVLQETASNYFKNIRELKEDEFKVAADYMTAVFDEIGEIKSTGKDRAFALKPIDFTKKHLIDIVQIVNRVFEQLNTFYNRWLDIDIRLNPWGKSEPVNSLVNAINQYIKLQQALGVAPISYDNFKVTVNPEIQHLIQSIKYEHLGIQAVVATHFAPTLKHQQTIYAIMEQNCPALLDEIERIALWLIVPPRQTLKIL